MRLRRNDLDTAYSFATQLAAREKISLREYRRSVMKLAWSYAGARGDAQALHLMSLLPVDYLSEELPEDASTDTELYTALDGLAAWLIERGHVDLAMAEDPMMHVLTVARA